MEITWIHYLLAFIALLINTIQKIVNRKDKTMPFNIKVFLKRDWAVLSLSVISIVGLFIMVDDILIIFEQSGIDENVIGYIGKTTHFLAFVLGWFNYSLIKFILRPFKKLFGNK